MSIEPQDRIRILRISLEKAILHITANSLNLRKYECSNQTSGIRGTLSEILDSFDSGYGLIEEI